MLLIGAQWVGIDYYLRKQRLFCDEVVAMGMKVSDVSHTVFRDSRESGRCVTSILQKHLDL